MKPSASSCSPLLPRPLARLCDDLEADHAFGPEIVRPFRAAAIALDREADDNPHAAALMQAISLIADQRRPARDRFVDIGAVLEARGKITVTIRRAS
jgi:hypothetical protein